MTRKVIAIAVLSLFVTPADAQALLNKQAAADRCMEQWDQAMKRCVILNTVERWGCEKRADYVLYDCLEKAGYYPPPVPSDDITEVEKN